MYGGLHWLRLSPWALWLSAFGAALLTLIAGGSVPTV
jgi:hypothetical protein